MAMPAYFAHPMVSTAPTLAPTSSSSHASAAGIDYRVDIANVHAHLFRVTLRIAAPAAQQRVSLPVWIPGSYLVREFAKNLQNLQAQQDAPKVGGHPPTVTQLDKCSWRIDCAPGLPLTLTYEVYAHDPSVRTAWLDAERGFFNGTSLCLRVDGQHDNAHTLSVPAPATSTGPGLWSLATGLRPQHIDSHGFGTYTAANYDELVDCPVEMGAFWRGSFMAGGVPHRFVVAGATDSFDGERLLADTQKICEAAIRFWHGDALPPHKNYLFMLNAVGDGYGGLEHRNSTALICKRQDLPRLQQSKTPDGYTTLLGLISHEYFHTWNVKRLRPAEFSRYDYTQENYTELLWFFEGFTSYYDDLLLRRAGLLDNAAYLKLLNQTILQVQQAPGRLVQSVAQASYDAWVKYYRADSNTPNATISYYTKGALVALCIDLTLRREKTGATLDDVMRALWQRCQGGPLREADVAETLAQLGGRSFAAELAQWVHGVDELPLQPLLAEHGVAVLQEPAQLAQQLGLRLESPERGGVHIKLVLRGGAAEQAGFAAGDEWLGVEPIAAQAPGKNTVAAQGWRMRQLDDLALYAGSAQSVTALISRDQRLLRLTLTLPSAASSWRLVEQQPDALNRWLNNDCGGGAAV